MVNHGEVLFILIAEQARQSDTHEQNSGTDLEVRAVVPNHAFEDLGM